MDALISTEWLAKELGASDLRVVDATLFLDSRDAAAEYEAEHIPGAVFMDLANLADATSPYPMMLPKAEKFASRMQSLGLGDGGETQAPMGRAIIGGVITSTLLTLLVIPTFYDILAGWREGLGRLVGRGKKTKPAIHEVRLAS